MLVDKFSSFQKNSYFSLLNKNSYLKLYIGLDEKGRKCIEYRHKENVSYIQSTKSIEVCQLENKLYKALRFSLIDDNMCNMFYKFCEDLEDTFINNTSNEGFNILKQRFLSWKGLFNSKNREILSEDKIKGLIGEILFLKQFLFNKMDITIAILSWASDNMSHKDFSVNDTWYEIKAINSSKSEVTISSLEQLESNDKGYLIVYKLEKMSAEFNGVTLNKLILDTSNSLSESDKEIFFGKLASMGYSYEMLYDELIYKICDILIFKVDDTFPKLTKNNINTAIIKAKYEISIPQILEFRLEDI